MAHVMYMRHSYKNADPISVSGNAMRNFKMQKEISFFLTDGKLSLRRKSIIER